MTKELVNRWFNKLGPNEQDMPLLIVGGNAYTPRATLDEVNKGTTLGNQLQSLIENQKFGSTFEQDQSLAKMRLVMSLQQKPQDKVLFVRIQAGKQIAYTPSMLIQEIQSGSAVGNQLIANEKVFMKMIVSVR